MRQLKTRCQALLPNILAHNIVEVTSLRRLEGPAAVGSSLNARFILKSEKNRFAKIKLENKNVSVSKKIFAKRIRFVINFISICWTIT